MYDIKNIIEKIVNKNNINISFVSKDDIKDMPYYYRSSCATGSIFNNPEIIIGVYDNCDEKLIAFLHEYSHLIYNNEDNCKKTNYEIEKLCWDMAFKFLNELNIKKTYIMQKYAIEMLETYKKTLDDYKFYYVFNKYTNYFVQDKNIDKNNDFLNIDSNIFVSYLDKDKITFQYVKKNKDLFLHYSSILIANNMDSKNYLFLDGKESYFCGKCFEIVKRKLFPDIYCWFTIETEMDCEEEWEKRICLHIGISKILDKINGSNNFNVKYKINNDNIIKIDNNKNINLKSGIDFDIINKIINVRKNN